MLKESDKVNEPSKENAVDGAVDGAVDDAPKGPTEFVHVRLDGKTKELIIAELSLTAKSTDEEIMAVLAKSMRVDIEKFSLFSVDRQKDGNIYLRPDAKFSER